MQQMNQNGRNVVRHVVQWPVQGAAAFRSRTTELVLSDVFWMWIFDALRRLDVERTGSPVPFLQAVDDGFNDPSCLVERLPLTDELLHILTGLSADDADEFGRLVPEAGGRIPSAEEVLREFVQIVEGAKEDGVLEMEIE